MTAWGLPVPRPDRADTTVELLTNAATFTLWMYRSERVHARLTPIDAARHVRDLLAVNLADSVLADRAPNQLALERYRVAQAIHRAVAERGAFDRDCRFKDLSVSEQFWNTGRVVGLERHRDAA